MCVRIRVAQANSYVPSVSVPEDYPAAGAVGTTSLAPIRLTLRIETMNCAYCDRIASAAPGYAVREADFDLGSEMPRSEVSVEGRRTLPSYEVDDLQRQSLALVLKFERG